MTPEEIRQTIEQLEQMAEEMENEGSGFQNGDMVNYTFDGEEGVAMVESVRDEAVTIRVMAVAGDSYEPTDNVLTVTENEISMMGGDADPEETEESEKEEEPEETGEEEETDDSEDEEEEDDDEKMIAKGVFVKWQSKAGEVIGEVKDVVSDEAVIIPETGDEFTFKGNGLLIEVYQDSKGLEDTGVHVALGVKDVEIIDKPETKPKRLLIKAKDFNIDESDESLGVISGLGSAYGKVDLGGDTVKKGSYTQTIAHNDGKVQLMFDHGWKVSDVAGIAELEDSEEGLMVKAKMPLDIQAVNDGYKMVKFMLDEGKALGFSIGYRTIKSEPLPNGVRELQELALEEMTITPYPMDTHARIRDAKSRKITYNSKRKAWQTLSVEQKAVKSDAPTGNQSQEGDYKSLTETLRQITTKIEEKNV